MGTPKGTVPWNAGNGTGWVDRRGYRIISVTVNGSRKQVREHRAVVEQSLGRALDPWELVHHINGDTLDNRIENLEVQTWDEHTIQHHTGRQHRSESRQSMELFANLREEVRRLRSLNADLLAALEMAQHVFTDSAYDGVTTAIAISAAIAKARGLGQHVDVTA